jgi:hypothetical protein
LVVLVTAGFAYALKAFTASNATVVKPLNDVAITAHGKTLVAQGRHIFRFDTFGDEDFWGGTLQLHKAIEGSKLGGVGDGVSPATALARRVLPVPGGPNSNAPLGILPPSFWNLPGSFKNSIIS